MDNNPSRTDLAGRLGLLLVILEIANVVFDLFGKVVNYNGRSV